MFIYLFLLLLVLSPVASQTIVKRTSLFISLPQTNIISSQDQVRFKFHIAGGYPPYTLTYPNKPSNSFSTQTYLFFNKHQSTSYYQIPLQIIATDAIGNECKVLVIIITDGLHYFLDNTLYNFEHSSLLKQKKIEKFQFRKSKQLENKIDEILKKSRERLTINSVSVDQIFSDIPTVAEIDELIKSNNLKNYIKSLYQISSLNCLQKIAYLTQIHSLIIINRQHLKNNLNSLNTVNNLQQLEKLSKLFQQYKQSLKYYNQYHQQFKNTLNTITLIKVKKQKKQKEYDANRLQILQIIASKQFQGLKQIQNEQQRILSEITEFQKTIQMKEEDYREVQDKMEFHKKQYLFLEIKIDRLQREKSSSSQDTLTSSNLRIIQDSLPELEHLISMQTFSCYGIEGNSANLAPQFTLHTLSYSNFAKYIRNAYGLSTTYEQASTERIQLLQVNIIDSIWKQNFGDYISNPQLGALTNSFSCLGTSKIQSQVGRVRSVKGNILQIQNGEGEVKYLLLGVCSRIQITKDIPQTGSVVLWKGTLSFSQVYDTYFMLIL